MTPDPARALARHAATTQYDALPGSAVAATRRDLADTFGCALGGSGAPGIAELLRLLRHWGGREEAGLLLQAGALPAHHAGMVHAAMAHALDYDDTLDEGGSIHPGACVLGALLATADLLGGIPGRQAVLAATLGLDVACRIALAATLDRGWHRTSAIGIFGATAVAGRLIGLDAELMHHAFGIAYSQAAGNRQCILDGALTKRFQAGQAAAGGIFSALLAREGFTGAENIFAGRFGFYELYQPGGYDLAPLTAGLGQEFRGEMLSFKPYPCGRPQHALLDAALALPRTAPEAIAEIVVQTTAQQIAAEFDPPHKRRPRQIVEAQFALPFLIAACVVHGRLGIDEVAGFGNEAVLALARRVRATAGPPRLILRRADGGEAAREVRTPARGAPANPMTDAERAAKFADCAAHASRPIAPAIARRAMDMLDSLDTLADLRDLRRLFA